MSMRNMAGTLHPGRVRVAAAIAVGLAVAAVWALWPPAQRGIVLYAAGEGAAPVARAFTRATGIPVTVIRLFTGPMLARIAAEGDRPSWSAAWIDGDIAAASLDRARLLEHHVTPIANWTPVGRSLLPRDGAWIPTGITLAGVSLQKAGNRSLREGMPDPALSGSAYPQLAGIAATAGGWPRAQAAMLRMKEAGLDVAPTNPAVIADLEAGRIGRARVQSNTAYMVAAHRPGFRVEVPRPAVVMPGVLMVAKGLSPRARREVDRFALFALSARGQHIRLDSGTVDSFYWPVTIDMAAVKTLPDIASLKLVHLDPYAWAPLQADITGWFEARVAGR